MLQKYHHLLLEHISCELYEKKRSFKMFIIPSNFRKLQRFGSAFFKPYYFGCSPKRDRVSSAYIFSTITTKDLIVQHANYQILTLKFNTIFVITKKILLNKGGHKWPSESYTALQAHSQTHTHIQSLLASTQWGQHQSCKRHGWNSWKHIFIGCHIAYIGVI